MSRLLTGSIVLLTISKQQADEINRRRTNSTSIATRIESKEWPAGAQAHIGNEVGEGDVVPMIIVKQWGPNTVNGQAFLDGNDTLWVTSATEGDGPGQYKWNTPEHTD
jgi:hypothetical protein